MSDGTEYLLPVSSGGGVLFTITLSPDGRWLGWSEEFTMVDIGMGQATRTTGLSGGFLVGISDDGAVLDAKLGQSRDDDRFGFVEFQWMDPHTGRSETSMRVTPGGEFQLPGRVPLLQPGSRTVVVPLFRDRSSGDPYFAPGPTIALVVLDLADGHVVSRLDLFGDDRWSPLGIAPNGVLLEREHAGAVEVSLIDVVTGERTDVARLPAGSQLTVRGGAGH
jgi:hypothetical protein